MTLVKSHDRVKKYQKNEKFKKNSHTRIPIRKTNIDNKNHFKLILITLFMESYIKNCFSYKNLHVSSGRIVFE